MTKKGAGSTFFEFEFHTDLDTEIPCFLQEHNNVEHSLLVFILHLTTFTIEAASLSVVVETE